MRKPPCVSKYRDDCLDIQQTDQAQWQANDCSFFSNRASVEEVIDHLRACDQYFVPPLSESVVICDYALKIVEKSHRVEAWLAGELVGLVAMYCNDFEKQIAFVTNVSVSPTMQKRRLAHSLMTQALYFLRELRFKRVELEVSISNSSALNLYIKIGFFVQNQSNDRLRMCLLI